MGAILLMAVQPAPDTKSSTTQPGPASAQPTSPRVGRPPASPHAPPASPQTGSNVPPASPQPGFNAAPAAPPTSPRAGWPYGWTHSGNVTAHALDMRHWPDLGQMAKITLQHLGGKVSTDPPAPNQVELDTNLCGRITIGLANKPSKAEAFRQLGCRVWIRGIPHRQRELDSVRLWLTGLADTLN